VADRNRRPLNKITGSGGYGYFLRYIADFELKVLG
jgi:hypothetical protein